MSQGAFPMAYSRALNNQTHTLIKQQLTQQTINNTYKHRTWPTAEHLQGVGPMGPVSTVITANIAADISERVLFHRMV